MNSENVPKLQQCLPFTVLKLIILCIHVMIFLSLVATVLTVYGIETQLHLQHRFYSICCNSAYRLRYWNLSLNLPSNLGFLQRCNSAYRLRYWNPVPACFKLENTLQWSCNSTYRLRYWNQIVLLRISWLISFSVATVLTVYGIETYEYPSWLLYISFYSCNSTYRLRYWNLSGKYNNSVPLEAVATVLTVYGIETH